MKDIQQGRDKKSVSWAGPRRPGLTVLGSWLIVGAALLGSSGLRAEVGALAEYAVKAAYLYQFTHFVEWPQMASIAGTNMFSICVLGDDPFGDYLDPLEQKMVKNRKLVIQRLKLVQESRGCLVVFVGESERWKLAQILPALRERNILSVSDMDGFAAAGGIIEFVPQGNRIRFAINVDAAAKAGLKISSKLLSLATIVGTPFESKER